MHTTSHQRQKTATIRKPNKTIFINYLQFTDYWFFTAVTCCEDGVVKFVSFHDEIKTLNNGDALISSAHNEYRKSKGKSVDIIIRRFSGLENSFLAKLEEFSYKSLRYTHKGKLYPFKSAADLLGSIIKADPQWLHQDNEKFKRKLKLKLDGKLLMRGGQMLKTNGHTRVLLPADAPEIAKLLLSHTLYESAPLDGGAARGEGTLVKDWNVVVPRSLAERT